MNQKTTAKKNLQNIKFNDFWLMVARELNQARLYLNPKARSLDGFILKQSDVCSYLHRAIKTTYKGSQCQNLQSPICLEVVLDTLGETAYTLQQEGSCDLFDIELLEEIAWLLTDRYSSQVKELLERSAQLGEVSQHQSAKAAVISFPNYKIRRANARL